MSNWVNVCTIDEISIGHPMHIHVDGTDIVVFKLDDGFYAIENVCTHDGGELMGGCIDNDIVICPRHGARFSIKTGEALSAPAYEATAKFPVQVENDIVQVRDDRWD